MPKGFFLSEADRDELQSLLEEFRGRRLNTTGRPRPGEDLIVQAPELYAALTPAPGIPALGADLNFGTGTGSGTGTSVGEGNTPGVAECAIHRLVETSGVADLTDADFTRDVYNLSESAIPGDTWILAARDKFGDWWALSTSTGSPGGGGSVGALTSASATRDTLSPVSLSTGAAESATLDWSISSEDAANWGDDGSGVWDGGDPAHLIAAVSGEYLVVCNVEGVVNSCTGDAQVRLGVQANTAGLGAVPAGVSLHTLTVDSAALVDLSTSRVLRLRAGDTVQAGVSISGGPVDLDINADLSCSFSLTRIGALP